MGYILSLKIHIPDDKNTIIYKKETFYSAKLLQTTLNQGEAIPKDKESIFIIDDQNNQTLLNEILFDTFIDWRNEEKLFDKAILDHHNTQYLEMSFDSMPMFVCLCQGLTEPYCFVRIFPDIPRNYVVEKFSEFNGSIYCLDIIISFL